MGHMVARLGGISPIGLLSKTVGQFAGPYSQEFHFSGSVWGARINEWPKATSAGEEYLL